MKHVNMFDTQGNEEEVPSDMVADALECGYTLDTRTAAEWQSDKAAHGYSMAMDMMGASL